MGWRKIVVDGAMWRYRIGRSGVEARTPSRKFYDQLPAVTGMTWYDIERGQWKRWFSVTPKTIAEWIRQRVANLR